jgi:hypothetical protein
MKTVRLKKAKKNDRNYGPSKMGERAEGETLLSMSEAQDECCVGSGERDERSEKGKTHFLVIQSWEVSYERARHIHSVPCREPELGRQLDTTIDRDASKLYFWRCM